MAEDLLQEKTSFQNSIVAFLEEAGASDMESFVYDTQFALDGAKFMLSVQNFPSVVLTKRFAFPDGDPFEFEQSAIRANNRDSVVRVRVDREKKVALFSISVICTSPEAFSASFPSYLRAMDDTEAIVVGLFQRSECPFLERNDSQSESRKIPERD